MKGKVVKFDFDNKINRYAKKKINLQNECVTRSGFNVYIFQRLQKKTLISSIKSTNAITIRQLLDCIFVASRAPNFKYGARMNVARVRKTIIRSTSLPKKELHRSQTRVRERIPFPQILIRRLTSFNIRIGMLSI